MCNNVILQSENLTKSEKYCLTKQNKIKYNLNNLKIPVLWTA